MIYFLIFLATFTHIFLKACQQINVVKGYYFRIPLVTTGMAACEVFSILTIVGTASYWAVVPMSIGGMLGCFTAMWVNKIGRETPETITRRTRVET